MNKATQHTCSQTRHILVRGIVQGVGFRPFVWRIANELGLSGTVVNKGAEVEIIIQGSSEAVRLFSRKLIEDAPPNAKINELESKEGEHKEPISGFSIGQSKQAKIASGIAADSRYCQACLAEFENVNNRRYHYPFINCTDCGPRFSIIKALPYDRALTTMASFTMCVACKAEYEDPSNRRYHAQPNACADCGPRLSLCGALGEKIQSDDPIADFADFILAGGVGLIKGLGGYQFASLAVNSNAISRLRAAKHRPTKALALMAKDVEMVRRYAILNQQEEALLQSAAAPIVLLHKKSREDALAKTVAPEDTTLGFMLPNTVIHQRLLTLIDAPIVLTSGNKKGEPQCTDDQRVYKALAPVAERYLTHNRPIENRVDDSIVRIVNQRPRIIRRARGYAPGMIDLPIKINKPQAIIALGSDLKNSIAITKDRQCHLSQYIGDLASVTTHQDFNKQLHLYQSIFKMKAQAIAVDMHPSYISHRVGVQVAEKNNVPLIQIQHHHAHLASCLVDNKIGDSDDQTLGVILDGLGYGDDSTIWGGEFLLGNYRGYERLARIRPAPLLGGDRANSQPWRNAIARICSNQSLNENQRTALLKKLAAVIPLKDIDTLSRLAMNEQSSIQSSSCGRLFDAVCALIDFNTRQQSYEGEAAMRLETLAKAASGGGTPYELELQFGSSLVELDPAVLFAQIADDLLANVAPKIMAMQFHLGLIAAIGKTVTTLANSHCFSRIALSGGVMQNTILFNGLIDYLKDDFEVLTHSNIPANDGGIAVGQAAIASAQLNKWEELCV